MGVTEQMTVLNLGRGMEGIKDFDNFATRIIFKHWLLCSLKESATRTFQLLSLTMKFAYASISYARFEASSYKSCQKRIELR